MRERGKVVNPNRPCENCGKPLGNRYANVKYCLRKECVAEVKKKWEKNWLKNKRRQKK